MVSINVAQLLQETPGSTRAIDFDDRLPDPSEDLHLSSPVRGHAKLTLTSRGVLVESNYRTSATLACARCLDEVPFEVNGDFSEEFIPRTNIRTGTPVGEEEEDPDLPRVDEHHVLHLDETIRQDLLTRMPFQPLCSQDCPGLCPSCGQRLDTRHRPHNGEDVTQAAKSSPEDTYQPFANLADLLKQKGAKLADEPDA